MADVILAGTRYSRLVVIEHNGGRVVFVRCDCGNERWVLRNNLVRGMSKSCGCARSETMSRLKRIHGGVGSRLYNIWVLMRGRCLRPNNTNYADYGGRGIKICLEWLEFSAFRKWAEANGYNDSLTIDRINNDADYSPDNCRWASRKTQTRNRRNTVRVKYRGKLLTIPEVAQATGKKMDYFYWKLRSGVSPDDVAADL